VSIVKERQRAVEAAKEFFEGLDNSQRWNLGDALVLGEFDWREWGLASKPSRAFLNELDQLRMLWEQARE